MYRLQRSIVFLKEGGRILSLSVVEHCVRRLVREQFLPPDLGWGGPALRRAKYVKTNMLCGSENGLSVLSIACRGGSTSAKREEGLIE